MKIECIIESGKLYNKYTEFSINTPYIEIWLYEFSVHKEIGPACIKKCGTKEYWLNSIQYSNINSDEEWLKFQDELIVKDIIE